MYYFVYSSYLLNGLCFFHLIQYRLPIVFLISYLEIDIQSEASAMKVTFFLIAVFLIAAEGGVLLFVDFWQTTF